MSVKISALPAASSVAVTDIVPIVNSGPTTQRATVAQVQAAMFATRLTPLDANHLHAWELDDASGNFADTGSSASKVSLTATTTTNAPLYRESGLTGYCASFGRSAIAVAATAKATALVSAFSDLPLTNVTMEIWYKCETQSMGHLMGCDSAGGQNFAVTGNSTTNSLGAVVRATTFRGSVTIMTGLQAPNLGLWHHVALVYDTTNSLINLYFDGACIHQVSETGNLQWSNGTTPTISIGKDQNSAGQFYGQLSRFRISNIARSQAYCAAVYKAGMMY